MDRPIILLRLPESPLAGRVAACLERAGRVARIGSLDAPLEGEAVTVRAGCVSWQGHELLDAGAIWVESPLFPWPQSLPCPDARADRLAHERWVTRQREARALAASALLCAAEARPVVNHPGSAHLAASPMIALDRLQDRGLPVLPWRLGRAPAGAGGDAATPPDAAIVLDAAGRDRWHAPARPPAGDEALILDGCEGPVETLLVVGRRVAARRTYAAAAAWSRGEPSGGSARRPMAEVGGGSAQSAEDELAAALAIDAASALGLDIAAVTLQRDGLIFCEAAPDLRAWDDWAPDRLAAAIADLLPARAAAAAAADAPRTTGGARFESQDAPDRRSSSSTPKGAAS